MSTSTLIKTNSGITQVSLEAKFFSKRCININGEITDELAVDFTDKILELNLESNEPITVLINSPGGEINSGLLMYDAIVGSVAPVRMICRGKHTAWVRCFWRVQEKDICFQTVNLCCINRCLEEEYREMLQVSRVFPTACLKRRRKSTVYWQNIQERLKKRLIKLLILIIISHLMKQLHLIYVMK